MKNWEAKNKKVNIDLVTNVDRQVKNKVEDLKEHHKLLKDGCVYVNFDVTPAKYNGLDNPAWEKVRLNKFSFEESVKEKFDMIYDDAISKQKEQLEGVMDSMNDHIDLNRKLVDVIEENLISVDECDYLDIINDLHAYMRFGFMGGYHNGHNNENRRFVFILGIGPITLHIIFWAGGIHYFFTSLPNITKQINNHRLKQQPHPSDVMLSNADKNVLNDFEKLKNVITNITNISQDTIDEMCSLMEDIQLCKRDMEKLQKVGGLDAYKSYMRDANELFYEEMRKQCVDFLETYVDKGLFLYEQKLHRGTMNTHIFEWDMEPFEITRKKSGIICGHKKGEQHQLSREDIIKGLMKGEYAAFNMPLQSLGLGEDMEESLIEPNQLDIPQENEFQKELGHFIQQLNYKGDKVKILLDDSPSCEKYAKIFLESLPMDGRVVDVYKTPNAQITEYLWGGEWCHLSEYYGSDNPLMVKNDPVNPTFSGYYSPKTAWKFSDKVIIFVGDSDGVNTVINSAKNNTIYWFYVPHKKDNFVIDEIQKDLGEGKIVKAYSTETFIEGIQTIMGSGVQQD